MRTSRLLGILLAALFVAPLQARADDTKPPVISDVKASVTKGKVTVEAKCIDETGVLTAVVSHRKAGASKFDDTPMTKNDYDDVFHVTFSGNAETEYYISSTDLLGNGPSFYGSAAKPMTVSGKAPAVAASDTPPPEKHHAAAAPPPPPPDETPTASNDTPAPAAAAAPPVIQHRKPSVALPDGQDFKLRMRITSAAGVKQAVLFLRPLGYPADATPSYKVKIPLTNPNGGEAYEATVPGENAHGTIEYFIMAADNQGQKTQLGDPDPSHWFQLTFKGGGADAAAAAGPTQPLIISDLVPAKAAPGSPLHIRAQATLPTSTPDMGDQEQTDTETKMGTVTAKILYRTQEAGDASMDMTQDPTGGLAGFQADLPGQADGAPLYYQVVMCLGDQCAIDTGSKRKWNAVTATNGDPVVPNPITAVSPTAPAGLPE